MKQFCDKCLTKQGKFIKDVGYLCNDCLIEERNETAKTLKILNEEIVRRKLK